MRTEQWFRERQERAEQRIRGDRDASALSIGTILNALSEYTDELPTEEHARQLAPAIGILTVSEYRYIVNELARELAYEGPNAYDRVQRRTDERVSQLNKRPDQTSIAEISQDDPGSNWRSQIVAYALALQALIWALDAPPESKRLIDF